MEQPSTVASPSQRMTRTMTPEENAIAWQIINYLSEIPCLGRTRVCIAEDIELTTYIQPQVVNKIEFIVIVPPTAAELRPPRSTTKSDDIVRAALLRWLQQMKSTIIPAQGLLHNTASLLHYDTMEFSSLNLNGIAIKFVHPDVIQASTSKFPTALEASLATKLPIMKIDDVIITKMYLSGISSDKKTQCEHTDSAARILESLTRTRPRKLDDGQKERARAALRYLGESSYSRQWFRNRLGV